VITADDLAYGRDVLAARWLTRAASVDVTRMRRTASVGVAAARAGHAIHGTGVGPRVVLGALTGDLAVRCYVLQKLPRRSLSRHLQLPVTVDGIPVDVIEAAPACVHVEKPFQQQQCDPLRSGISTGRAGGTFGTLGAFCRSTRQGDLSQDVLALSNHHVFTDLLDATGGPVYQPGPSDAVGALREIGTVRRSWHVEPGTTENRIDAAVAILKADVPHDVDIPSIGRLRGRRDAQRGFMACKFGRTTRLTEGVITDIACRQFVGLDPLGSAQALFVEQIRVDAVAGAGSFGGGGDSGALLMEKDTGMAIGLYFAGAIDGSYGLANHMSAVCERLDIELLTG